MRVATNLPEWFVPFDERLGDSGLAVAHLKHQLEQRDKTIESLRVRAVMGGF